LKNLLAAKTAVIMRRAHMTSTRWFYLRALLFLGTIATAHTRTSAADSDPPTLMTLRGKLLLSEDLKAQPADVSNSGSLTKMKSGWKLWSGKWEFADGAMKGAELASDHRGAVAACVFHFKEAVIQFDVRMDGARQVHFRIQDFAPEHICRVILTKDGFAAQKDDHDHAGPDQPVPFGRVAMPIKPGEWKTVLVEIKGEEMVTTIDGKSIAGSHPLIAAEKCFIDFVVSGEAASFRNLRVWEVLPNPQWAQNARAIDPKNK